MLRIENVETFGWEPAMRGMRNPKNSWEKSDSIYPNDGDLEFQIGSNDMKLATTLADAGQVHGKFLRMIVVSLDVTAPLYWWKEFDTYKVGTVANSCSTMHRVHSKAFTREDFSHDRLDEGGLAALDALIAYLEAERQKFVADKTDRQSWHNIIQLLPSSYNQMRTVSLNYENLINIYYARRTHKLAEWHTLCDVILTLPYAKDLISVKNEDPEN